ncbi:MAG: glycosyl hydrolase family 18 protein [Eubacteriales bacterium]|nr:glycosyl hydrolase family 18 protein [Eubacteriales bacterium]
MKKLNIILSVLLVIALIAAGYFAYKYFISTVGKAQPQDMALDLQSLYAGYNDDNLQLVFEGQVMELPAPAKKINDMFYLPLDFVVEHLSTDLFYDKQEKVLTYTDKRDVVRLKAGEKSYFYNNEPVELQIGMEEINGVPYLPTALVAKFANFRLSYSEKYHVITVDNPQKPQQIGVAGEPLSEEAEKGKKKEAAVTYVYQNIPKEGEVAYYYYPVSSGMTFVILEERNDYYKVRTHEGFLGYVKKEWIRETEQILESNMIKDTAPITTKSMGKKVNLVWHQVFNMTANNSIRERMQTTKGVNVISPTWFHITDTEGSVSSLADIAYVKWAHQNGYKVWPLFSNSFDKAITHEVLSSTAKREKVIRQILGFVDLYELDGINIDFEEVPKEDGPAFVQFVKEISLFLKQKGVTVSVDMYVPKPWTAHYGRAEIGKYIDYLIIMGYDEHWSTSPKSGSVASIGFVREGVVDTLESLPASKVILGLPFYTRLWQETGEGEEVKVKSKAYGMGYGKQLMIDKGAKIEWDEETAQYYGEYKENDVTYKMWMEDKRSLEQKLNIAQGYRLAGVAGWKLGLESEEAWEAISQYLKQ